MTLQFTPPAPAPYYHRKHHFPKLSPERKIILTALGPGIAGDLVNFAYSTHRNPSRWMIKGREEAADEKLAALISQRMKKNEAGGLAGLSGIRGGLLECVEYAGWIVATKINGETHITIDAVSKVNEAGINVMGVYDALENDAVDAMIRHSYFTGMQKVVMRSAENGSPEPEIIEDYERIKTASIQNEKRELPFAAYIGRLLGEVTGKLRAAQEELERKKGAIGGFNAMVGERMQIIANDAVSIEQKFAGIVPAKEQVMEYLNAKDDELFRDMKGDGKKPLGMAEMIFPSEHIQDKPASKIDKINAIFATHNSTAYENRAGRAAAFREFANRFLYEVEDLAWRLIMGKKPDRMN